MEFNNQQIDTELLPSIEDLQYSGLQSDYKKLLVITISIVNVILLSLFLCYAIFDPLNLPKIIIYGVGTLIVLRAIWSFISAIKRFEFMSYALREKDIVYNKGWLWRQTIIVPFNRVQHIQVDQGPLERKFN
jgi:membrane protein YdbS with pleckstrin-like domain